MTARAAAKVVVSLVSLLVAAACTSFYEIPIETPIQPKLDVSAFQRVLIVGFISGGSDDVDTNLETVRLLRSQLRTRSNLRVIEADVLPLAEVALEQTRENAAPPTTPPASDQPSASAPVPNGAGNTSSESASGSGSGSGSPGASPAQTQPQTPPATPPQTAPAPADATPGQPRIRDEKDLVDYERIFANVAYWKKLGEEYQQPLIVTGTILFNPQTRNGIVTQQRETYDQLGRRTVVPVRVYQERKGYVLRPKFVFIDGRTGATLYTETFREERLYPASTNTPALSSYFEMMDTLLPSFLNTLSAQKVRGSRILLKD